MNAPIFEFTNYESMREAFRLAKTLRGMSNTRCDELANLSEGHTDKILGPTGRQGFSPLSFDAFCWMFAVKFVAVPDPDREQEMAPYWADRQRKGAYVRNIPARVSKIIIERAKPLVLREMGRLGGLKTASQPSAKLRNQKAGKSRMRKLSKKERTALARMANGVRWRKSREVTA